MTGPNANPLLDTQNNADVSGTEEPLLTPSLKRFVILPIEYHDVRSTFISAKCGEEGEGRREQGNAGGAYRKEGGNKGSRGGSGYRWGSEGEDKVGKKWKVEITQRV